MDTNIEKDIKYIIEKSLKEKIETKDQLAQIKRKASRIFNKPFPRETELLKVYYKLLKKKKIKKNEIFENLLIKRKIRGVSGVAVITVLTKPWPCPGQCIFCPNEARMPKSYLAKEPAAQRALNNKYSPFRQMKNRIKILQDCGHLTEKIDLIILGGTWSFYPKKYREYFVKRLFDAANNKNSKNILEAQKKNETAKNRIIGLTIETRPDYINLEEIKHLRRLGVTRLEIGVQSVYDDILIKNKRGHTTKEVIEATKLLKDAGFKVNYHIMLNLYGSSLEKDEKMFDILFENENFQPDYLKIYPTVVLKTAALYNIFKEKKFKPYTDKQLIDLTIKIKQKIPYYVRVQRLFRDIPKEYIVGGSQLTNLRQIVQAKMKELGLKCKCIRCRQAEKITSKDKIELFRQDYKASQGHEIFLSFESKNREKLFAFLRLRIPSNYFENKKHFLKALNDSSIIRELHTYGKTASIFGKKEKTPYQHKGLGKKLLEEAEKITKNEFNLKKIAVISGIGVRNYYRKLGYKLKDTYMVKKIK